MPVFSRLLKGVALLALLPCLSLHARDQKVRDVDIRLTLIQNGNVVVHERWDVDTGDKITEWYLVRENLGDIGISRFSVFDGDERLQDDGEWDVDRTREQKAGRYGIVHKPSGVELCWGVGEYGDHQYHALYVMERAVKSLEDYDMLHLQVVSDGLSAPPQHVRVTVAGTEEIQLDTTHTRIWGFGYRGSSSFKEDGTVVFETDAPLETDDSVIILLRFDKGTIFSPSVQDRPFQEALDRAMYGASFGDEEQDDNSAGEGIAAFFTLLVMYFAFLRPIIRSIRKESLKQRTLRFPFSLSSVPYYRDVPMKGSLPMAHYVMTRSGNAPSEGGLPQAFILRLIYQGCVDVSRLVEGPTVLSFTGKTPDDPVAADLLKMLKEAAGVDGKLQDKEFSQWAKIPSSGRRIHEWVDKARDAGLNDLVREKWLDKEKFVLTDPGQEESRHLFGFKRFLETYTLSAKREAFEAHLWKEYLVYAALFGVTARVYKQLKDIDPALFKETFQMDPSGMDTVLAASSSFSGTFRSILSYYASHPYTGSSSSSSSRSSSSRGYGGSSSRSGGGGYSGGGRGGGGR